MTITMLVFSYLKLKCKLLLNSSMIGVEYIGNMMAASSSTSSDDCKVKLSKLLEEWNEHQREDGYNPIPFLTKISTFLEKETEEFHKQDPDPFDDRHPLYTTPRCALGKLLKMLTNNDNFLTALIGKYLMSRSNSTDQKSGERTPALPEAAARLLLAILPALDTYTIFTDNPQAIPVLYRWATNGTETLQAYATGILAGAGEHQDINAQHHSDNAALIPILLKRLWGYVDPGRYPRRSNEVLEVNTSEHLANEATGQDNVKVDLDNSSTTTETKKSSENKKRKISSDFPRQSKYRKIDETIDHVKETNNQANITVSTDFQSTPNDNSSLSQSSEHDGKDETNVPHTSNNDIIDVNECSNSSWVEMMPIVIGCSFNLDPPLSPNICQRFILNLLIPLGEYQDFLSFFLEHHSLDLIKHYLDKCNTNDGLLTFSALRFLASLLCHNKIATTFIEDNGVQRLLSVRRPSIGATGVSLCIYYLAYNHDAMERVCQLQHKVLQDLVKYATWLLECSHDSGRSHAALFFNISFQFHVILKLFDQRNGLRYLMNMLGMLPIFRTEDRASATKDDDESVRQIARTTCQALRKYFETHLIIKAKTAKQLYQVSQDGTEMPHINSWKVGECDRETVHKHLDFLLGFAQPNLRLPPSFFANWTPVQSFMKLDGIKLFIKLIAIAFEWTTYSGRNDIVRFALDCLAVVTLSPKAQIQLCSPITFPPTLTGESGIGIVLWAAEGGTSLGLEPETQKSALSVIVNCVCRLQHKFDSGVGRITNGTPQTRTTVDDSKVLWECVKTNNGIKILLHLLTSTQPVVPADDIRLLACKALCGLSRCDSVKQIMSKLPLFTNGQLQALTKQPVMQDGKKQHILFCKYVEELTERVTGKPSKLNMDLDSLRKVHIVSETIIRYDNRELLQLIHNHLSWSGLHSTASLLAREASLHLPTTSSATVFSTPKNTIRTPSASGDAPSPSPLPKRICFTKGTHAHGETPTLQPHSSLICTPTMKKCKTKFRYEVSSSGDHSQVVSSRYRLASNGKVTVMKSNDLTQIRSGMPTSPVTLNTIVSRYLQDQHAQCKNPVVTVPEFSLMRPHSCPNPRFRVEAPLNVASRYMRRQIAPRCGGLGGASCDRHFIYSRFRPHLVFRPPDEDSVPYTCCAFTPDDLSVVLGNYQGDLTIHRIESDEDRVIEGVANAPISHVELAKDGKRMLVVEDGLWRSSCSLLSMETFEPRLTYDECSYAEFSKTTQDKVIGTKNDSAVVYDSETGQKLFNLKVSELASHYKNNKATFSPDDDMVLSDGVLWDVRASGCRPIHKFDKFNLDISGIFHPINMEVIINTEVWDLRNYHLLHTVPTLDLCNVQFNSNGAVLYAAKSVTHMDLDQLDEVDNSGSTTFMTMDSRHYVPLSITDTKHRIYDFAVDRKDYYIAVIERQHSQDWDGPPLSLCRLFEIGRVRGEDEEDDQDDDGHPDDDDDDDHNDDDYDPVNVNDDDNATSGDFSSNRDSNSSYDTPSFAVSMSSSGSSFYRNSRRRRRRRRRYSRGRNVNRATGSDDDDGWSTIDDGSSISSANPSELYEDIEEVLRDGILGSNEDSS